jgi:phosphoenolpyruvate-protein phosphotransferase (PTS system enzyme I)
MQRIAGIGASPGVVAGRAVILIQREQVLRYRVPSARVDGEIARLSASRDLSREQLADIRSSVNRRHGAELASMFDAQLLMLDDQKLVPRAAEMIRQQRVNAAWAIQRVFDDFSAVFDDIADEYLRERKGDIADLAGRLKMNLRPGATATPRDLLRELDEASVLVADELPPSIAAQVDWNKVRGFATDAGSRTYHTAILARSLGVPAVVGLQNASRVVQPGQLVAIDGDSGELVLDPSEEIVSRARLHVDDGAPVPGTQGEPAGPAVTADGVRISLDANIEFPDDLAAARYAGAEGIGLYRSEFLLMGGVRAWGTASADEEEQYGIYRRMVEGMAPGAVTIRTFDLDEEGGGMRGLRLSLLKPEPFRRQLRALLRASKHGALRIMFPFVTAVEELRDARRLVREVAAELGLSDTDLQRVPVGAMIEVPGAAYTADLIAREADFFTIGTNDLIQYCLAVDRSDARVSQLYEPLHPAILRMVVMVRRAARRRGIRVSLCGEMASDPVVLALLVGMGLTEFSMTPAAIPLARRLLQEMRSEDLRAIARRVLKLSTIEEIESELERNIVVGQRG